jgi:murein L,D-transpeptidase YcbB/YkuD
MNLRNPLAITLLFATVGPTPACRRGAGDRGAQTPPPARLAPAVNAEGPLLPEVGAAVRGILDSGRHPALAWPEVNGVLPSLEALYAAEPDGLFWFAGDQAHPALPGALDALAHARDQGLVPADYDAEPLARSWQAISAGAASSPGDRARFDVALTVSAMRLLSSVHEGRVDPRLVGFDYDVSAKRLDLARTLRSTRDTGGFAAAVASAEPSFPVYRRLVRALAGYRALAAAGEPDPVPRLPANRRKVQPGQRWDGLAAVARRLRAFGDLPADAAAPATDADGAAVYEGAIVDAVKRFQGRHTLESDGVIGRSTIDALNVPAAARVRQLELALERERWLPELHRVPHVFVNVPLFRLWANDPDRPEEPLHMNVVVGETMGHETPVFVAEMEYVVFRPYWNPPPSIVRDEIVPRARRDPDYLGRQDMELVATGGDDATPLPATPENLDKVAAGELFVRQKPGEKNSLGLAKFIFPNADNVYMHGTPAQSLFARARRDFSHGCIRLEDPARLAEWVLRGSPEWPRERIDAAMRGERPTQVNLKSKLAVFLFYDTAYVDSKGVVYFADDYYGHDARLEKALGHGYPYPRKG